MSNFFDPFVILSTFVLTLGLTIKARRMLLARAVLDRPNERSLHEIPVPRGGGWAILLAMGIVYLFVIPPFEISPMPSATIAGRMLLSALAIPVSLIRLLIAACYIPLHFYREFVPGPHLLPGDECVVAGVLLLAFVSWQDDKKGLNPAIRFAAHIVAAMIGSLIFGKQTLFAGFFPFWLDRAILILGWAWFINLYNFMDGIDGITGVETVAITAGCCLLLVAVAIRAPFAHMLGLLLIGSSLGFLALNWYPAKIFLGDVGSVPLGFLTGFLLLTVAMNGHLLAALILPLYYLADSGITITRRALRGEKIWQAHREHFYQKAAQKAGRHDKVVCWIAIADIALIAAALWTIYNPWAGFLAAILIVAALLVKMARFA